jgi:hypothetical protein
MAGCYGKNPKGFQDAMDAKGNGNSLTLMGDKVRLQRKTSAWAG